MTTEIAQAYTKLGAGLRTALACPPRPALAAVPIEPAADHAAVWDEITGCEIRIMDVGPELASYWLKTHNTGNRGRRPRVAGGYAGDMAAQRWRFTGAPVCFGADGQLYDGQHRLLAIERSGKPQRLVVIRGLKPEARGAIDGGLARKLRDDLIISGYVSKQLDCLIAIATRAMLWNWKPSVRIPASAPRRITRLEQADFVRAHPELEYCTRRGVQVYQAIGKSKIPPSIAGFVFWLASGVDEDAAHEFFHQLISMEHMAPAVRALRKRTVDCAGLAADDWLYLMLKAWVLFRNGRGADRLMLPRNRRNGLPLISRMIPDPATVMAGGQQAAEGDAA